MATDIKIDDVTYEIRKDDREGMFYIKSGFPFCYLTYCYTGPEIGIVASSMRQLGFTVIDKTQD